MCEVFAGQDPHGYACETRSVRLSGHVTSVRLETRFWSVLEDLAASNFASLLRCSCLIFLTNKITPANPKKLQELAA